MLKNRPLVIILVVMAIIILAAILLRPKPKPEPIPSTKTGAQIEGFDQLLDYGLTSSQLGDFKYALGQYLEKSRPGVQVASLKPDTMVKAPHQVDSPGDVMNFDIKLDDQTVKAKLEYSNLTAIRLYLSQNGSQVYDSNTVDLSSNPPK